MINKNDKIIYLTHKEINKSSWDRCIDHSFNGLIYAYSFYLDHMAENWNALILNDYEAVMPLPQRKKFGISYLFTPFLTAQLGLFGNNISGALLEKFLEAIPGRFQYWDMQLNHYNQFYIPDFNFIKRINYVLDLDKSYDEIQNSFRENTRRNISKSLGAGCKPVKDIPITEIIKLSRQQINAGSPSDYEHFRKLFQFLKETRSASTYGILGQDNSLIASAAFLFSHKRAYYILVGNHPEGRKIGASHTLINEFVKDHASQDLHLDFEGSDISSLGFFYSGFGAVQQNYISLVLNKLPKLLKWIK